MSFNNAVLDLSGQPNNVVIDPTTAPLNVTGNITLTSATTADFVVDPADWDFPQHNFTEPVPGTIDAILNAPATGNIDFATGKVTMTADIEAQVGLGSFGQCSVDTGPLAFSTDNTEPLPGQRFPAGAAGVLTGAGAITAGWAGLPPGTGPGCPIVDNLTGGAGGFWLSRNIAPDFGGGGGGGGTDPAKLAISVSPKKVKVDAGKKAKFKVTVSNTGDLAAAGVKVCAKAKKPLKAKPRCREIGSLAGDATAVAPFKIKTSADDPGKYKVKFTASGTGLTAVSTTAKIKAKG